MGVRNYTNNISKKEEKENIKELRNDNLAVDKNNSEEIRIPKIEDKNINNNQNIAGDNNLIDNKISLFTISKNENLSETNIKINNNINNEFKNIIYDPKGYLEKKDTDIVDVKSDGNCLYRCISYFLFNTQEYFKEIKNLAIDWIKSNYEIFVGFFGDDENNNMKKDNLEKIEFNYMQK